MSRLPAALRGALWMVGALLSFSLMAVSVRELLRTMGNFEILFLRSLVSFVLVLAVLPRFGLGALVTFLVTVADIPILNIGAPFWGLVFGYGASRLLERSDFPARG